MKLHAYRRSAAVTIDLLGESVEFTPNKQGDVVADVASDEVAERLLGISEAYRPYEPEQADNKPPAIDGDAKPDLEAMTVKELRSFADASGIKLPHNKPAAELRQLLAEALNEGGA